MQLVVPAFGSGDAEKFMGCGLHRAYSGGRAQNARDDFKTGEVPVIVAIPAEREEQGAGIGDIVFDEVLAVEIARRLGDLTDRRTHPINASGTAQGRHRRAPAAHDGRHAGQIIPTTGSAGVGLQ
ncbi:MAG: hypothetical protein RQ736_07595 [Thiogranum sp.]|nr:hypothetical protein [Thiogranum sp.]